MKIGLIARADKTGLAVQTHGFYRNMHPYRTLVVDLSYCSGKHPDMSMYPGAELWKTTTYPDRYSEPDEQLDAFLDDVDVVFTCETPYNYWLFERAREKGVRTVLQFNYEFLEYLVAPSLPKPDLFAAPSTWNLTKVKQNVGLNVVHLPVPVDLDQLSQSGALRQRKELYSILHTVGNPAMEDRNGTNILLEAIPLVKSDVRFNIRSQRRFPKPDGWQRDQRVKFDYRGTNHHWEQYSVSDDLYVMPRRFGGLCLPVNEALTLGIPVLMSKCPPNEDWLPSEMLVPGKWAGRIKTRAPLKLYNMNPYRLAERIDYWVDHPSEVERQSAWARQWAFKNSWASMRKDYEAALEGT